MSIDEQGLEFFDGDRSIRKHAWEECTTFSLSRGALVLRLNAPISLPIVLPLHLFAADDVDRFVSLLRLSGPKFNLR